MNTVWNTPVLQVPASMIEYTKAGNLKMKNTLTKKGSIAQSHNQPAFQLMTSPNGHFNIVEQGDKLNMMEFNKTRKAEASAYRKRVKAVEKARAFNANPVVIPVEKPKRKYVRKVKATPTPSTDKKAKARAKAQAYLGVGVVAPAPPTVAPKPKRKYVRKDPNAPVVAKRKYVRKVPVVPSTDKKEKARARLQRFKVGGIV